MELVVNVDSFSLCTGTLSRCESVLRSIRSSLASVQYSLTPGMARNSGAGYQLREVVSRLDKQRSCVGAVRTALGQVESGYRAMERKVRDLADGDITGDDTAGKDSESSKGRSLWDWDDTWGVIGEFGIIGAGISAIGSCFTGGVPAKGTLGFLDFLSKGVERTADAFTESSFDWKRLCGFNYVEGAGSFKKAFLDQIDDLKFGSAKGVAGNTAVAARWAGHAVTVGKNVYDNFFGGDGEDNSFGRSLAETIGESAVDIGLGLAVTALATTVGAPAVVAGVAAVGVKWVLDTACEHFTGKDTAEFVSDLVLDAGEAIYDGAKKVGNAIGNAVSTATDTFCKWWKGVFA